jgi:hypothetical protein
MGLIEQDLRPACNYWLTDFTIYVYCVTKETDKTGYARNG